MAEIICGDALTVLRSMPDEQFNCCVTSPPYWGLRDYGVAGQLGLEPTPEAYVAAMVEVFREVRRVLRGDGTLWLNLGDTYQGGNRGGYSRARAGVHKNCGGDNANDFGGAPNRFPIPGIKPKDLVGIPWRVAFALQADGWYLRSDIIWHKPNPMPESVTDRPTKSHEYLFLLAKSEKYYYNAAAIAEPCGGFNGSTFTNGKSAEARKHLAAIGQGERTERTERNKRSVWTIPTKPYAQAHFATFPEDLVHPCILAGCPPAGRVLDPFAGSGTTLKVARWLQCDAVGIELNPAYCDLGAKRDAQDVLPMVG